MSEEIKENEFFVFEAVEGEIEEIEDKQTQEILDNLEDELTSIDGVVETKVSMIEDKPGIKVIVENQEMLSKVQNKLKSIKQNNKNVLINAQIKPQKTQWFHSTKNEGIKQLKEYLKKDKYEIDDLALFEVDTSEKNWKIRQIGWKDIVKSLI